MSTAVAGRTSGPPRTVLVDAGPWLPVPPPSYGGIENVVATLVPQLRAHGTRVVLATVGESTIEVDERITTYEHGQFAALPQPYNRVSGVAHAHLQAVVRALRARDDIDLVHSHVEVVGPAVLAAMGPLAPPTLHTLHWDLGKHRAFYEGFDGGGRVWVNGVSRSQLDRAPAALRRHALGFVPLGTALPATPPATAAQRGEHVLVLGRVTPLKGQAVAARVCAGLGQPLVLAGPVGPYASPEELDRALAEPGTDAAQLADVAYFLDEVRPHLDGDTVRWVGSVGGPAKDRLVRTARAVLMPVQWEEPGATVVVEALAAGTPVIATRRGVLPTLVNDGRTGFLADGDDDLARALKRLDEIDPGECRAEAERRFSDTAMAEAYLRLYAETVDRSR